MLREDNLNSRVVIIDWGLATIHSADDPPMTAFAGSAFSVAPEVIRRSYGKECDLWSCGVITFFLLTRGMPFNANTDKEIFRKILSGQFSYSQWAKNISEEAKDFIDKLLVVNPKYRMTAKQALAHSWIRKHNHPKQNIGGPHQRSPLPSHGRRTQQRGVANAGSARRHKHRPAAAHGKVQLEP